MPYKVLQLNNSFFFHNPEANRHTNYFFNKKRGEFEMFFVMWFLFPFELLCTVNGILYNVRIKCSSKIIGLKCYIPSTSLFISHFNFFEIVIYRINEFLNMIGYLEIRSVFLLYS